MKVSQQSRNGFCLTIALGNGHQSTKVPPLASEMLHAALTEAGVTGGKYTYQVMGAYHGIASGGIYRIEVTPGRGGNNFRVNMKCGKSSDSTVTGIVHVPTGTELAPLFSRMKKAAFTLNGEQWSRLKAREENPSDAVVSAAPRPAPSASLAAPVSSPPSTVPAAVEPAPAPALVPVSAEAAELASLTALLVKIVKKFAQSNGVFDTKGVGDTIRSHYPDRQKHGLVMGRIWKFESRGWIRRVKTDSGVAWQVAESFVKEQGIPVVFTPLPGVDKAPWGHTKAKKKVAAGKKVSAAPAKKAKTPKADKEVVASSAASTVERLKALRDEKIALADRLARITAEIETLSGSLSREDLLKLVLA